MQSEPPEYTFAPNTTHDFQLTPCITYTVKSCETNNDFLNWGGASRQADKQGLKFKKKT